MERFVAGVIIVAVTLWGLTLHFLGALDDLVYWSQED